MPIYTYRCETCGVQFDRRQSFTDLPLTTCPECNKKSLRKVIAPVGIVFKGSGWYSTDHKSPSGTRNTPKSEPQQESSSPATESKAPAAESKTPAASSATE